MSRARLGVQLFSTELPRELVVLYLVAPLLVTPVISGEFFQRTPGDMLREIATNYVAFLSVSAGVHAAYHFAMPALVARARTLAARLLLHALAGAVVAASVALLTHPAVVFLFERDLSFSNWTSKHVVITWAILLPTLVIQELRGHAETMEMRLLEQQRAALRAQLEAIQSRTNPHFLFNSMNTVASLIQESPDEAERTLERLAEVLRYALQSSRLEKVRFEQEIAMLRDYLEIQRARFGERLKYEIDVEPAMAGKLLPPLLLQPLVENAVLHGVAARATGGSLRIEAHQCGERLEIRVADDGPGPGASSHRGSGTSLIDLRRRIELLYAERGSLLTERNELGGLTVTLALPVGDTDS